MMNAVCSGCVEPVVVPDVTGSGEHQRIVDHLPVLVELGRLGGLVEEGSVRREEGQLEINFVVTDMAERVTVSYSGILPDLFREGQGIIAQGSLNDDNLFVASEVLAKHDENYMPPEVAEALAKGHQEGSAKMREAQQTPIESKPL